MRLFVVEEFKDYKGNVKSYMKKNTNIDYVCWCSDPNCKGYGTQNRDGYDEECGECGKPLDWKNKCQRWN